MAVITAIALASEVYMLFSVSWVSGGLTSVSFLQPEMKQEQRSVTNTNNRPPIFILFESVDKICNNFIVLFLEIKE